MSKEEHVLSAALVTHIVSGGNTRCIARLRDCRCPLTVETEYNLSAPSRPVHAHTLVLLHTTLSSSSPNIFFKKSRMKRRAGGGWGDCGGREGLTSYVNVE